MAQDFSFDVVSKVDLQELKNAVDQTLREIGTRFDFKDSVSNVELEGSALKLHSDDEYRLKALIEVLQGKLVRRGVSLKAMEYGKIEPASKGTVRQEITVRQGIDADKARQMSKLIRDSKRKVQAQIQGDQLRVSSKSKDELQAIMQLLRGQDFGIDLQFVNYR
jgi:cyclic-di-GMP-binding protein